MVVNLGARSRLALHIILSFGTVSVVEVEEEVHWPRQADASLWWLANVFLFLSNCKTSSYTSQSASDHDQSLNNEMKPQGSLYYRVTLSFTTLYFMPFGLSGCYYCQINRARDRCAFHYYSFAKWIFSWSYIIMTFCVILILLVNSFFRVLIHRRPLPDWRNWQSGKRPAKQRPGRRQWEWPGSRVCQEVLPEHLIGRLLDRVSPPRLPRSLSEVLLLPSVSSNPLMKILWLSPLAQQVSWRQSLPHWRVRIPTRGRGKAGTSSSSFLTDKRGYGSKHRPKYVEVDDDGNEWSWNAFIFDRLWHAD